MLSFYTSVLSNRGPQLLIDLEWLRKNLNEADFKTLESRISVSSLRLRKSLERQIVTFVDVAFFCCVTIYCLKKENILFHARIK